MQAARRVVVNTGFLYARMGVTVFISLYSTRIILGALGLTDFGIFNVIGGAIAMLGFLNASMASATQRFMSYAQGTGDMNRMKQIFNASIILHFLIAAFLLILLEVAGYFLFGGVLNISTERVEAAKLIFQFMVVSTLFTVISVPYDAVINARENMLLLAILGVVESLLKLAIALYLTYTLTDQLVVYGLLMACLSIFLLLVRRLYCKRKYAECSIDVKKYFHKQVFKEMTGFAGWSFLGSFSSMTANYGQMLVLNAYFGPIANAAQGVVNQLNGQLGAFALIMLKAINPMIAKSEGAKDRALMLKVSIVGSKISFFLLMLMYVPFIVEMPYILNIWLKNVPPFAIIFCQLQLIRNLIEQIFLTLNTSIGAVGEIRKYKIVGSVLSLCPLIATYVLFEVGYPAYTLYIVFIVYALISSVNTLHFANKTCGLSIEVFFKKVIYRCTICFVISFMFTSIPSLMMPEGATRTAVVVMTSLICFITTVWKIGLEKNEQKHCKEIIGTLLKKAFPKAKKIMLPKIEY